MLNFNFKEGSEKLTVDKTVENNLKLELIFIMKAEIKQRFVEQLLPGISPKNFIGEAMDYLYDHSLEQTEEAKLQYATLICEEIKNNISSMIYVNDGLQICLHHSLFDFEYGSYFKPALKLITKSLQISSKAVELARKNKRTPPTTLDRVKNNGI